MKAKVKINEEKSIRIIGNSTLLESILHGADLTNSVNKIYFKTIYGLCIRLYEFNAEHKSRKPAHIQRLYFENGKLKIIPEGGNAESKRMISEAVSAVNSCRRQLRSILIARAKNMHVTVLFESRLLPDWQKLMPDDHKTCRKILAYAEKTARLPVEWERIASWYRRYLNDEAEYTRCLMMASQAEGV